MRQASPSVLAVLDSRSSRTRGAIFLLVSAGAFLIIGGRDVTSADPFFHPHGYCYLWQPGLVWTHVTADMLIGLSYMTIPLALLAIVRRTRGSVPFSGMLVAFGTFIVACGLTHFVEVLTLWKPWFWTAAGVKVVTAMASVATAVAIPSLVPRVVSMMDAASLAEERRVALERARSDLEHRVSERTQELTETIARLREEIAARARVEQRLGIRDAQLQGILDHSPSYIYVKDRDGRFALVNRRMSEAYGGISFIGRTNAELFPAELAREYDANDRRALAGETVQATEREVLADGLHTFLSEKFPVRDAHGQVIALGGISSDITDRERIRQQREALLQRERELRQQAEQNLREKDEFLAVLSHELRTPLNAVLGYVHILRSGRAPADRMDAIVSTIDRNARSLWRLVEDLLTVSGIVTKRLELRRAEVDIRHVLRAAIDAVQPHAAPKQIVIDADLPQGAIRVAGDEGRLQQVFTNLLDNAVKFSAEKGRVQVRARLDAARLRVTVSDDGGGIAPEFLPHVFEAFRQGDLGPSRLPSGLGLGLAIVRRLIERHGGEVHADSPGRGRGATFTVWLPLLEGDQEPGRTDTSMSI
jgi:PAS domain S-box-containing protein